MFKIIKIEYYDKFKCWNAKCPANCCDENWNISIDEETYNKYFQCNIENLDEKITRDEPHLLIKHEEKCPFITSEGLCSIHSMYGEDFLSNTCKSYPRFVSDYGDVYIEALGLSCPAVVKLLLGIERKCLLLEENYYESVEEKGRKLQEQKNEKVMKQTISFFYQYDSLERAFQECYKEFGVEKKVDFNSNKLTIRIFEEINLKYPFFLVNMCISYLFEHIMLESKKDIPEYVSVLDRCLALINIFEKQLLDFYKQNQVVTDEGIITSLYKVIRKYDHGEN